MPSFIQFGLNSKVLAIYKSSSEFSSSSRHFSKTLNLFLLWIYLSNDIRKQWNHFITSFILYIQ